MELVNHLYSIGEPKDTISMKVLREALEILVITLSPFAPHISEELWENFGYTGGIMNAQWRQWDESALEQDEVTIVLQVNGKVRSRIQVASDMSDDELKKIAIVDERIQTFTEGKQIKKVIIVPQKLVNIVV
jgi:leucyl-tRNA synthetase